jgi:hypothetical protein
MRNDRFRRFSMNGFTAVEEWTEERALLNSRCVLECAMIERLSGNYAGALACARGSLHCRPDASD